MKLQTQAERKARFMERAIAVWCFCVVASTSATAASPTDVMIPVRQFVDSFNKGDSNTALAAYVKGQVSIVDEFAP